MVEYVVVLVTQVMDLDFSLKLPENQALEVNLWSREQALSGDVVSVSAIPDDCREHSANLTERSAVAKVRGSALKRGR